jgi:hypothetical protein
MRSIFISFLLILPGAINSQNLKGSNALLFWAAPQYCGRAIHAKSDHSITPFDSLEKGTIRMHYGVQLAHGLSQHLQATIGLNLDRFGFQIDSLQSAQIMDIRYHYNYASLPIGLNYVFVKGKLSPYVGLCFSYGVLVNNIWTYRTYESNMRHQESTDENLVKTKFSGIVKCGFNTKIHEKYSFTFGGIFQYNITPLANGEIQRRLYSWGLQVGISRDLNHQ